MTYYATYEAAVDSLPEGWEITDEGLTRCTKSKRASARRVRPDGAVTCFAEIQPTRTPQSGYKTIVWYITYQPCYAPDVIL